MRTSFLPDSLTPIAAPIGRAFVGAEDALEVRVGLKHRLGDFGRLQMVAAAVLDVDDLDVRMLGLHLVEEAVAPIDAGAAGLIMHDDRDFACVADQPRPSCRRRSPAAAMLSVAAGRERNVAVDAGVEGDDRDLAACAFFNSGMAALLSSAAKPSACGFLASAAESMSICLSTIASVSGPSKVILTLSLLGRLLGAGLHRLPELVLEALRDERDIGFVGARAGREPDRHERADARRRCVICSTLRFPPTLGHHRSQPLWAAGARDARSFGGALASSSSRSLAPQNVGIDRENDDEAGDHDLPFLRDRHDAQAVGQHAHDEGADDGAENRARPPLSDVPPITTAAMASSS